MHSYASSAKYDPLEPGNPNSPDRGGCVAMLTPGRMMSKNVAGHGGELVPDRSRQVGGYGSHDVKYGMVIDVGRCIGCYNCFLACRDEHVGNDHLPVAAAQPEAGHRWIDVKEHERGTFPKVKVSRIRRCRACMCADAPCMKRRTDGAVYAARRRHRADRSGEGQVGQRKLGQLVSLRVRSSGTRRRNTAQKCTFCAHLLDEGWKQPRCVEVCPTQALVFGDLHDSSSAVATRMAEPEIEELRPELANRTLARYIGLPKRFVCGEVVLADQADQPAPGVTVTLRRGGEVLTLATDSYGDFDFKSVTPDEQYLLQVSHPGYAAREIKVSTAADVVMGEVRLDRL